MFSYYGSKSKIIKKYPAPTQDVIIEPFAGSARYALEYWFKDVTLVEKYKKVYSVWVYLQDASENDILSLPDVTPSTRLENISGFRQLSMEEKWLIGFCSNQGSASPKNFSGKRNGWNSSKLKIAKSLYKIKHWKIINDTYENIENRNATWFIDPPYQNKGKWYTKGCKNLDIDYKFLSKWCKSRLGQVIVCENDGADWLDFSHLTDFHSQKRLTKEVVWIK